MSRMRKESRATYRSKGGEGENEEILGGLEERYRNRGAGIPS